MVEVELRTVPPGDDAYQCVATLRVADDDTWEISGQRDWFDLSIRVADPARAGFLSFETDPQSWARNLHRALRSGHVVAVVTADTETVRPTTL